MKYITLSRIPNKECTAFFTSHIGNADGTSSHLINHTSFEQVYVLGFGLAFGLGSGFRATRLVFGPEPGQR